MVAIRASERGREQPGAARDADAGERPEQARAGLERGGGGREQQETARELAYRLYVLCDRKKWNKEALADNALVVSWPEIMRLTAQEPAGAAGQQTLV